ncbi:MAG: hypothetical protein D6732_20260, partial [Methanobacteriota archaeon]
MATDDIIERFIQRLSTDPTTKAKVRKALDLEDDYARKSDLVPILERLEFQGEEIKALREAMEQGFSKVWDELKAQRESTERGFSKVWDELKVQRDELKAQREELKAQREAMEQGFSKVWDELKAQRESTERGFS